MLYEIEVSDGFFPTTFKGLFRAESKEAAVAEAKEDYAMELGTTEDEIEIISVREME